MASLVLAAVWVVAIAELNPQVDVIDYQYREHRTALAQLAEDYRSGRLPEGTLTLPPHLRSADGYHGHPQWEVGDGGWVS